MTREGAGVFVLLLLVLSSSSPRQSISVDPQFHACVPQNCGNLSVSFPFWIIGVQEAFCGLPGFHLYCDGDAVSGRTLLNLSTSVYAVTEISYRDQYLRVAMNALYISECDSRNGQNLENSHFVVGPNQEELVFLTNCTERVQGEISTHALGNCSDSSGSGGPVAVVFGGKWDVEEMAKECTGKTRVPATLHGDESKEVFLDSGLYNEVVGRGFLLRWTAPECYLCVGTGGRCGFDELSYHYRCFCPDGPHVRNCTPTPSNGKSSKKLRIAIGSGGAAIFIIMICLVLFIMRRGYRQKTASSGLISKQKDRDASLKSELDTDSAYCGVPIFPYHELEKATNYFDSTRELGDGGFGTVYYGILQDGREVAVKRLYENNYKRVQQFMNEIKILTRLRHKNLVTLYGCTSLHSRELLLVYEFIANGTVADHVHGDRATHTSLAWPVRLRIAAEAANALAYLHASGIIHRDVKTSNILLDNSFSVKVADFGLSRLFPTDATHVSTAPQGTPGYVDPEYHKCYQLTERSDVYSFGVVLIELISSLPAVDISRDKEEINLASLAVNRIQNQEFSEFLDPCLRFESDLAVRKMVVLVAELAFQCLQPDREQRPSMGEVLKTLKSIQGEHDDVDQATESAADDYKSGIAIPMTGSVDRTTPAVPETEDGVLLKGTHSFTSPISVTDTWASRSTISSSSTV